jgi:transcriptional regulator with XRE-family HTH domain
MEISNNIIAIRTEKRIKQTEIAEKLGIEPPNYSRLEKRGKKLTVEQLEQIADALGVTMFDLLGIQHIGEKANELKKENARLKKERDDAEKLSERHEMRFQEIFEELLDTIKSEYGIDFWKFFNYKKEKIDFQNESWFIDVLQKYRLLWIGLLGSDEIGFNQDIQDTIYEKLQELQPFTDSEKSLAHEYEVSKRVRDKSTVRIRG